MMSCSSHFFNKTNFEKYLFKNDIAKKLQNFPHCFLATQVRSIRTNQKEQQKSGEEPQVAHHCSYTLVKCMLGGLGGKLPQMTICVFHNPCRFYLKSFVSLVLIGQLV